MFTVNGKTYDRTDVLGSSYSTKSGYLTLMFNDGVTVRLDASHVLTGNAIATLG